MQFVLIGLDGTDSKAAERRIKARQAHIEMGEKLRQSGNMWYGAALLHDDGTMKGSMILVDFPTEEELNEWLDKEPYVVGKVWKDVTIHKSNTRDPWQYSRPQEWFEKRNR
ncbi:MAG TPA: YciI family protein [Candidatus Saccharimonadales bacterium]